MLMMKKDDQGDDDFVAWAKDKHYSQKYYSHILPLNLWISFPPVVNSYHATAQGSGASRVKPPGSQSISPCW